MQELRPYNVATASENADRRGARCAVVSNAAYSLCVCCVIAYNARGCDYFEHAQ